MAAIPYGYCHCGCGEKTTVPAKLYAKVGRFPGVPVKFKQGHYPTSIRKAKKGPLAPAWKGGTTRFVNGYIVRQVGIDHPMADKHGRVYEHRVVMSEAIGRSLERDEVVHHINGIRDDNRIENLELFGDDRLHRAHHRKLKVGG